MPHQLDGHRFVVERALSFVADFTFDLNVVGLEDIGLGYFLRHAGRRRGFGTARDDLIEPFPSCLSLAELQYVDCLGDLAGFPGAAAELVEDVPGLEPMPLSLF
jgi:hypothetical protein